MKTNLALYLTISLIFNFVLTANTQIPDWLWAESAGGDSYEGAYCSATDQFGNILIAGKYKSSSIDFGSFTLNNAGGYDIFIAKYNSNGNILWVKSAGGSSDEKGSGICTDASGNIYMTGFFKSPLLSFGDISITNTDSADMFVVKYDPDGNAIWANATGGSRNDYGKSVACDANNNVYISGYFKSATLHFGTYTLTNYSTGFYDMFLVKYSGTGNVIWAENAGGDYSDRAVSVTTDNYGNVYVTGYYYSSEIDFGNYTITKSGSYDLFLVKYNPGGSVLWATGAGDIGNDRSYDVAVDPAGNAYVTGFFDSQTLSIGSDILINTGGCDMFFAKYDTNGNPILARSAEGSDIDKARSITVSNFGDVFLTGYFKSSAITFGNYVLNNVVTGFFDIFIAKYNINGEVQWAKNVGGSSSEYSESCTMDNAGNLFISGRFYSPNLTFGNYTLGKVGWDDIFIAKIPANSVGVDEVVDQVSTYVCPNPAIGKTFIYYNLPEKNMVTLKIYDKAGNELQTLVNNIIQKGQQCIAFDGTSFPDGIYFYKINSGIKTGSGKIVLLK